MIPNDHNVENLESLSMTKEEKERALESIFAVIDSADPPIWAGLPLPKKDPLWKRILLSIKELLF